MRQDRSAVHSTRRQGLVVISGRDARICVSLAILRRYRENLVSPELLEADPPAEGYVMRGHDARKRCSDVKTL